MSVTSLKSPWQWLVDRFDTPEQVKRSTYAFMPAALEVEETPASPIGRAIIWVIVILFVSVVVWGIVGKIDVVAVGHGKIIPSGRIKTIQPLEIGKVKTIHVQEGQAVTQGQSLVTLDSTATQADTDRLQEQLDTAQLQQDRQQLFHVLLNQPALDKDWQKQAYRQLMGLADYKLIPNQTVAAQHSLLVEQVNEYQHRVQSLQHETVMRRAEQRRIGATATKLERTLPLITERAQSLDKLMQRSMVARAQYLELEQERIEQEQDLLALKAQYQELAASIQSALSQRDTLKAEAQKNNLAELNETTQKISALQQELIKAQQRNQQRVIASPIDGTVQQLAVHTIGGVVTPAQELMKIVPTQSTLEVEAMILNKDIGFVEAGQTAEVKIDTFNFTKYGTIDAQIISISNDAISDENLGLVYMAKVLIKESQMEINNKLVNLSPGMSVTVEVKTGKRRVIEYFMSPLLRYKQESIRER
jgi:hemolysin D